MVSACPEKICKTPDSISVVYAYVLGAAGPGIEPCLQVCQPVITPLCLPKKACMASPSRGGVCKAVMAAAETGLVSVYIWRSTEEQ